MVYLDTSALYKLIIVSAELVHIDFVITFDNRQAEVFRDLGYKVRSEFPVDSDS